MNHKLDGYIIRKFLGTFFASIAIIVVLIIVFDISEKIGVFIERDVPIKGIIFEYYMKFVPFLVNMFSFLFIFISVIFFTSRIAQNSEVIAMLSSGISFPRLLVPFVVSALIIGLFNSALANFVIPNVNKDRLAFERQYMRKQYVNSDLNIHMRYNDSVFFYAEFFNYKTQTGTKFTMETIKGEEMINKFSAENIRYDSAKRKWIAMDYVKRELKKEGEIVESGNSTELDIPLVPLDFAKSYLFIETLNFKELNNLIEQERIRGSNRVKFLEFERWQRFIQPFAAVILTLIGVALSIRKSRKGGIGLNLAIGIFLAFTFIFFMQFSKVFATAGSFPVWLAAWLPLILYGIIGAVLLRTTPK